MPPPLAERIAAVRTAQDATHLQLDAVFRNSFLRIIFDDIRKYLDPNVP